MKLPEYKRNNDLVVIAGKEYGTGSSRLNKAAKQNYLNKSCVS